LTEIKIFFASDIHGSEICFRKFLNAGKAYQADAILMGGDITGKMIVPMVETGGGTFAFQWLGTPYAVSREELDGHLQQIRMSGCYPYQTTPDEMALLEEKPELIKDIFRKTLMESVRQWLYLAEERLKGSGIECYITPGNDDDLALDEVFINQNVVCNPEHKLVYIKDDLEMIACGYSNRTPWNSPRELNEEDLWKVIDGMAQGIANTQRAIFNFHCPPFDVGLDLAPRLDKNLKPIAGVGGVDTAPVGSKAVLKTIQAYRPMLGLHGHVHESRGVVKIGRTFCVNPGSEYSEGILRGCLILIDQKGVKDYMLTAG